MLSTSSKVSPIGRGRSVAAFVAAGLVGLAVSVPSAFAVQVTRWNAVKIQSPAGIVGVDSFGELFGNMVCVSASDCWSAGTGVNKSGRDVPFIEHWDGSSFRLVKSPVGKAFLQGLACVTARDCWLAGGAGSNPPADVYPPQLGHFSPLMEHWNGKKWATANVPNPAGVDNELADVSCISTSSCYAVGWTSTATSAKTLIEHWTGKKWTVVSNAATEGQTFARLDGIDCVPHSVCNVVGQEQATNASPPQVFGERGTKAKWSAVSMPSPPAPNNSTALYGMSCPAANDCLATGSAYYWPSQGYNPGEPIAEHWNGTHWSLISPTLSEPATGGNVPVTRLSDVACASTALCWAVGATAGITGHSPAVTASWDGSHFTLGDNDSPDRLDQLGAVDCVSTSRCFAVGYGGNGSRALHPIAEKLSVLNCPRCRLAGTALVNGPKPGRTYRGTLGDYFNNAPRWTRETKGKASFKTSKDGTKVLDFRGSYSYYCGAGTAAVTANVLKIGASGKFYGTDSKIERESTGKVVGTNYYMLSGQFVDHGDAARVSYLDDFVYAGKKLTNPYSTTFHKAPTSCESWVHGTVAVT